MNNIFEVIANVRLHFFHHMRSIWSKKLSQRNNTNFSQKSEFNTELFNEIALKFVISSNIPFRVLDNPFLKRLIDCVSSQTPECRLYSSKTMKYRLLKEFSINIKSENLQKLRQNANITIAMDG